MNTIPLISHEQYEREQYRKKSSCEELWELLDQVKDPEIPVISIWDLGVLRDIEVCEGRVVVTITPTYSGCPAMETIRSDIKEVLNSAGYAEHEVKTQLAPAWTSEWMSAEGRKNLRNYGIAPPEDTAADITPEQNVACPRCSSENTVRVSEFGSTACKALFQCRDCGEPFDYFKKI
ncbi:MAG: 1,2-phenylacetyl-CoA epoxidase subunit PaaD [Pseudomonadales bacterium]